MANKSQKSIRRAHQRQQKILNRKHFPKSIGDRPSTKARIEAEEKKKQTHK